MHSPRHSHLCTYPPPRQRIVAVAVIVVHSGSDGVALNLSFNSSCVQRTIISTYHS